MEKFYPFLLDYTAKDYIWGGKKLNQEWNKHSESDKIAETWELSINSKVQSKILNGKYKGFLSAAIKDFPEIVGEKAKGKEIFPLLVKLIDAEKALSIQVHPGDDYALRNEGQLGKCEMWYVCEAEDNAEILLGLNAGMTKEQIVGEIENGGLDRHLNKIKCKKGDCFLVPEGTLHAIGAGLTILEVQENSDVTYRVYDYNRTDNFGNKRELHIQKALQVMNFTKFDVAGQNGNYSYYDGYKFRELIHNEYFTTDEVIIDREYTLEKDESFAAFTVVEGEGEINGVDIKKGDTLFLPAKTPGTIKGKMTIITICI